MPLSPAIADVFSPEPSPAPSITIVFDREMDEASVPPGSAFALYYDAVGPFAATSVAWAEATELTLSAATHFADSSIRAVLASPVASLHASDGAVVNPFDVTADVPV